MSTRASNVAKARRSRAGCSNCRRQRIKCDEQYPTCCQCAKRRQHCNLAESRFRTYEPQSDARLMSVRHAERYNYHSDPLAHPGRLSINLDANESERQAGASDPASLEHDSRPVAINALFSADTQSHNGLNNPASPGFSAEPSPTSVDEQARPHVSDSISAFGRIQTDNIMSPERISGIPVDRQADSHEASLVKSWTSPRRKTPAWRQTAERRHEVAVAHTIVTDQTTSTSADSSGPRCESVMPHTAGRETSKQRACLLRHFSSTTAKWMDLFDLECFYSRQAPILALHSPLIMYSACALAAKQLSAVSRPLTRVSAQFIPLFKGTCLPNEHQCCADYEWTATAYYDAAISRLLQHISDLAPLDEQPKSHSMNNSDFSTCRNSEYATPVQGRESRHLKPHDEIVVAATILAIYEFLAGDAPTWSDHLDGTRSFLRLSDEAGFLDFHLSPSVASVAPGPSGLLRAAFWNFARQDMLSALIHGKRTRLELEDIAMWRRMGVSLGIDGSFVAGDHSFHPEHDDDRLDTISNTLVWMLARIVNFIAIGNDTSQSASDSYSSSWIRLKNELGLWFDALPPQFGPCSEVQLPRENAQDGCSHCRLRTRSLIDQETWYSESMCASTIQSYHMAEIFLLLHKPRELPIRPLFSVPKTGSTIHETSNDALGELQQMSAILQHHAVKICGIALSRPEEAARIHMLQPLYLAGRCLTDMSDRRIVVALIDSIQDELGWHAKYRVEALLAEWGITRAALDCCQ